MSASDTDAAAGPPLIEGKDPFSLFDAWIAEARTAEPNDPNAMAVATVDADGLPDVRMVLLKAIDPRGLVFYTNTQSDKGRQLHGQPMAAALFHWKSLRRQIRVRGPVEAVTEAEADAYFRSRPRDSQIGAWASDQSRPMQGRFVFEKRIAEYTLKFGLGEIPRPPHWSGFRILPVSFEFWRDRPFRLHDRLQFRRDRPEGPWLDSRLFP